MASQSIIKLTTIIFLLALNSQISFSQLNIYDEEDEPEYYILDDDPIVSRPGSRLLASVLKKGASCKATPVKKNICNGVKANKGTSLLYCCKKHCRNVLGDRNNCGKCGRKCAFAKRCCHGKCTNIVSNKKHCGKCDRKCAKGVKCEFSICGYN